MRPTHFLLPVTSVFVLFFVLGANAIPSSSLMKNPNTDASGFVCPGERGFYPHPENCELYYGCWDYIPTLVQCPGQQLFDLRYHGCNWPELTDCGNRTRPEGYPPTTTPPPVEQSTVKPYPCPGDVADGLYPDSEDCSSYYRCVHGVSYHYTCANPLLFNIKSEECDFRSNVDCGSRPIPSF
ncbi:unnamed protein product [Orchesella dallaii]|uniref:Chitin-binding type-2 domain-containing protein n=1 Tax=Orchesella dallaii TaxID=48710 RepID=A0ABP1S644_9HEXA